MRCRRLFHCFRGRDERSTSDSVSQLSRAKSRRGHDSKNRLSALFLSQEDAASSGAGFDSMHIDKDQKDEAQFLKGCGTTPAATPIEIRKASGKLETPQRGKHLQSPHFHSSVFHLDEKTDRPFEEVSGQTPSSCLTDARNSSMTYTGFSDASGESQEIIGTASRDRVRKVPLTAGNFMGKTKTVLFESDVDQSYSSSSSKNPSSRDFEMAGKTNIIETLSSPTSTKQSDEIQTPGAISPVDMESAVKGKPRISSQYVHSASSLSKPLEDSDESLQQAKQQTSNEKTETESTTSLTLGENLEKSPDENHQQHETNLSPIVKQGKEKSNTNIPALSTITSWDRPIIGMVAAHWNEKEQSQISPKWWDGNGIPNSTNKYKEDQKVSWHATPFEERLEKALSEESSQSFIPPSKFGILEDTERDTAISNLQHSTQFNSVVSF